MTRIAKFRLVALLIGGAALTLAYERAQVETLMIETAQRFLDSLTPEQKEKTVFDFAAKGRELWHFVPGNSFEQTYGYPRRGLTYKEMTPEQGRLADALLSSGLSRLGYVKAVTVMSLEEILRIKENDTTGRRDVERYHYSIFGTPSKSGKWGWRVEGHHVSVHFTLQNGKLVGYSPTFFGANPHEVREGPRKGLRVLGREEDLARELVRSLNPTQLKAAIVDDVAYRDILTRADTRAKLEDQPPGLPAEKMNAKQYEMLLALVDEYASNLPAEFADARRKQARAAAKDRLWFAWAGSIEPGKGDYYRVQSTEFLIEYDNTQNNNNHSHTVWRDFTNDFGRDLLALHHRWFDHGLAD